MSITDHDKFVINAIINPNYPLDFQDVQALDNNVASRNDSKQYHYIFLKIVLFRENIRSQAFRGRR